MSHYERTLLHARTARVELEFEDGSRRTYDIDVRTVTECRELAGPSWRRVDASNISMVSRTSLPCIDLDIQGVLRSDGPVCFTPGEAYLLDATREVSPRLGAVVDRLRKLEDGELDAASRMLEEQAQYHDELEHIIDELAQLAQILQDPDGLKVPSPIEWNANGRFTLNDEVDESSSPRLVVGNRCQCPDCVARRTARRKAKEDPDG